MKALCNLLILKKVIIRQRRMIQYRILNKICNFVINIKLEVKVININGIITYNNVAVINNNKSNKKNKNNNNQNKIA